MSFDGKNWNPAKEKFLFSSKALAKRFKKRFIDAFKSLYENGELEFAGSAVPMKSKKGFKILIRKLWQKEWAVYSKAPFGGPEAVLEYIGRYTHRVAITNNRILSLKVGEHANLCPKSRKGHMTKILELAKPKIMSRRVRIVVIDSS